jgi:hypothetical protein
VVSGAAINQITQKCEQHFPFTLRSEHKAKFNSKPFTAAAFVGQETGYLVFCFELFCQVDGSTEIYRPPDGTISSSLSGHSSFAK